MKVKAATIDFPSFSTTMTTTREVIDTLVFWDNHFRGIASRQPRSEPAQLLKI